MYTPRKRVDIFNSKEPIPYEGYVLSGLEVDFGTIIVGEDRVIGKMMMSVTLLPISFELFTKSKLSHTLAFDTVKTTDPIVGVRSPFTSFSLMRSATSPSYTPTSPSSTWYLLLPVSTLFPVEYEMGNPSTVAQTI